MFKVIPAIDILNGKVVRLTKGDYNRVDHYDYTPAELAKEYESNGATRIHIVDLDGAKDGKLTNLDKLKEIRNTVQCELEFGGGVRSQETVQTLLDIGINYVVLGSLLIKDPETALNIIKKYPGKIIAGIDANNDMVAVEGWIETSAITIESIIKILEKHDVESIVYTDIAKDGTLEGPNFESLSKVARITNIPIIASGGVSNLADVKKLRTMADSGIKACIVGKAILAGRISLSELFA
jgi:phosphoribosylformimino-5-aminoimidazole carboxamide ribotide isomerase